MRRPLAALDSETTGPDWAHGCRPFMFYGLAENGTLDKWVWEVNPQTRVPHIPPQDKRDLQRYVDTHQLVFHNAKFDLHALLSIGIKIKRWDYHDTLIASHVYNNLEPHGLKWLALKYLDILDDDEADLQAAVKRGRTLARSLGWNIAHYKHPMMPGLSEGTRFANMDYWLPAALALYGKAPQEWADLCGHYCELDVTRTLGLWLMYRDTLYAKRGMYDVYEERRKLIRPMLAMELRGVTLHEPTTRQIIEEYSHISDSKSTICFNLADNKIDNLASTPQLRGILYDHFGIEPKHKTEKGQWSTAKEALKSALLTLPRRSKPANFIRSLQVKRKVDVANGFMDAYLRFSLPVADGFRMMPTNFNLTGTRTTRFSASQPNTQNVSKQEDYNVRRCFGPLPDRVWYAIDYANIELRILAYTSGESELINAFERGESVHMLFAWVVCPEEIRRAGGEEAFKKTDTYRRVKNGDFSITYGATAATADATYGIPGAYDKVRAYFTKLSGFMDKMIKFAKKRGYINTLGGYRLYTPPGKEYTTAVDYLCQGTAGDCMNWSIVKCFDALDGDNHMIMTIHDELVFDMPSDSEHQTTCRLMQSCMEEAGTRIGIPTPTEADLITDNWATGVAV